MRALPNNIQITPQEVSSHSKMCPATDMWPSSSIGSNTHPVRHSFESRESLKGSFPQILKLQVTYKDDCQINLQIFNDYVFNAKTPCDIPDS